MNYRPTIKDIAAKLNLHHSTVSRALRDHPDIQLETKNLIKKTAEKLNYQPNIIAQNLKQQKTNTIGVIVPEIKHNFFSSAISGMEEIAYDAGYIILLSQSNENFEREKQNTKGLISNRVAGLLVSLSQSTVDIKHFELFQKQGGEIVFFDRISDKIEASKVIVDDFEGAYKATEYLIKKGYKKIAHLAGTKELSVAQERFRGYATALKKNKISVSKDYVIYGGLHEEDGKKNMEKFLSLSKLPDAVFAINDPVAQGAYEAIKAKGLKIPDDIAVVGFSNNQISALLNPPLTTVHQPAYEMGKEAMKLLIEQIESPKKIKPKTIVLKTKIIKRNSA